MSALKQLCEISRFIVALKDARDPMEESCGPTFHRAPIATFRSASASISIARGIRSSSSSTRSSTVVALRHATTNSLQLPSVRELACGSALMSPRPRPSVLRNQIMCALSNPQPSRRRCIRQDNNRPTANSIALRDFVSSRRRYKLCGEVCAAPLYSARPGEQALGGSKRGAPRVRAQGTQHEHSKRRARRHTYGGDAKRSEPIKKESRGGNCHRRGAVEECSHSLEHRTLK